MFQLAAAQMLDVGAGELSAALTEEPATTAAAGSLTALILKDPEDFRKASSPGTGTASHSPAWPPCTRSSAAQSIISLGGRKRPRMRAQLHPGHSHGCVYRAGCLAGRPLSGRAAAAERQRVASMLLPRCSS
ncbi:hypothetical protein N2152v2_008522 [Parachlorella kessleri]